MVRFVGDERHPESIGKDPDVQLIPCRVRVLGQRHADLGLARTFGLDRPTGAGGERAGVDGEVFEDHRATLGVPAGGAVGGGGGAAANCGGASA